jgi:type I restriction enzyme M protein
MHNRYHRGVPPKSKGDYAFISHMIETTYEDTGRVGVIMPHGALFRGSSEGKIRQQLIEENLLEAVIGLPANLFFGTGIPASILIFNKAKGSNTDVLFIDASKGYEAGKNQNKLRDNEKVSDINKIVDTYVKFKTNTPLTTENGVVVEDKYAFRATIKDLQDNDYNLNIPRYVDTFVEEEAIDVKQTQETIVSLKNELVAVEDKMNKYLMELGF